MPDVILTTTEEQELSCAHGLILCTQDEAEYLMHFGIKGQKHGIRRWQNEDGSLTPEGYIHYGIGQGNHNRVKADKLKAKADKIQLKADKYKIKAEKYSKKADKQEAQGKEQLEKDRAEENKQNDLREQATQLLKNRMNEYDALSEIGQGQFSKIDAIYNELKASKDGQSNADPQTLENAKSWFVQRKAKEVANIEKLHTDLQGYKDMDSATKTKVGKQLLEELAAWERSYREDDPELYNAPLRQLQDWLVDTVYDVSGSINAGSYKKESKAYTANELAEATQQKVHERENQIKENIGYQKADYNSKKFKKEEERLRKALEKDSVWKELNKQWDKELDDTIGAVLQDLGFEDTTRNRQILWNYGWWD